MNEFVTSGIRVTRRCNMNCKYCNIPSVKKDDLSLEEWKEACKIIKKMGIDSITILGGEPTLYKNIVELVYFLENELDMRVGLTTNALNNYETVLSLIEAGISKLGVSVDTLNYRDSISPGKAKLGLNLLNKLLKANLKDTKLVDYIVLNRSNLETVYDLIEYMTKYNISSYILPFHHGNEGSYEHRKNNKQFAISKDIYQDYCRTIDNIINMKETGCEIINSKEFLLNTKKHILGLDRKCTSLSELRIDSNGRLQCCCDKYGDVNKYFTIYDLEDENKLNKFIEIQKNDRSNCSGCLWPSQYEAERKKVLK